MSLLDLHAHNTNAKLYCMKTQSKNLIPNFCSFTKRWKLIKELKTTQILDTAHIPTVDKLYISVKMIIQYSLKL